MRWELWGRGMIAKEGVEAKRDPLAMPCCGSRCARWRRKRPEREIEEIQKTHGRMSRAKSKRGGEKSTQKSDGSSPI